MQKEVYSADFATLRKAYIEIRTFLEEESCESVTSLSTKVVGDLGLAGDDNYYLLVKLFDKYNIDYKDFDYNKHFLSEGELWDSSAVFLNILLLPFWLLSKIPISGFKSMFPEKILNSFNRETTDLTFGDIVIMYLTKSYNLRSNTHVKLLNT